MVLSVDTSSPEVMLEAAAARGVGFINDVRALSRPEAIQAVAATGLPVCLMHMQGEPDSMQRIRITTMSWLRCGTSWRSALMSVLNWGSRVAIS